MSTRTSRVLTELGTNASKCTSLKNIRILAIEQLCISEPLQSHKTARPLNLSVILAMRTLRCDGHNASTIIVEIAHKIIGSDELSFIVRTRDIQYQLDRAVIAAKTFTLAVLHVHAFVHQTKKFF